MMGQKLWSVLAAFTAALGVLVSLLVIAAPVNAHVPYIEPDGAVEGETWGGFDAPVLISDPAVSYAFYGYLDDETDVDVFRFDFAEADEVLRAEVLTPVCGDVYRDFYPTFAIFGPAPAVERDQRESLADAAAILPFEVPADVALLYVQEPEVIAVEVERPTWIETFAGTVYYDGQQIDYQVPIAATYYVAVFDVEGNIGDYTLGSGRLEVFSGVNPLGMIASVREISSGDWLHADCDA